MKRIKKFGVYQTARMAGVITLLLTSIILLPLGFFFSLTEGGSAPGFLFEGGVIIVVVPLLYSLLSFIMTALGCLIYNFISRWIGGIEVQFESVEIDESQDGLI